MWSLPTLEWNVKRPCNLWTSCGREWGVEIAWVEYLWDAPHRTRVVDFATASRNGEPYAALIDRKGFVPSVSIRYCSGFAQAR